MNTDMHGKQIKEIRLAEAEVADGCCPFLKTEGNQSLELSSTYHGDHDELWVLVKQDGIETSRINTRAIAAIVWV